MTGIGAGSMMAEVKQAGAMRKAGTYLWRATKLRCPVCGRTPIFPRALSVRRLSDWFTPFDGCPRCGYAFEREPGYFLMAIWAINYGCGSLLGLAIYLILELYFHPSLEVLLFAVLTPVVLFNFFFARHSKAYFIALDHLFDPHHRDGGDDGGNQRLSPDVSGPSPGEALDAPTQSCETTRGVR